MSYDGHLNYAYIATEAERMLRPGGLVLDYGCGKGRFVELARSLDLDCEGCDRFEGPWSSWIDDLPEGARGHVSRMEGNAIPFPDAQFDLVVSNQVFEHVSPSLLPETLNEIRRVLKPGGALLFLFPTRETWYEGHFGLYFPHLLPLGSRLQFHYLRLAHKLGLGLYPEQGRERDADPSRGWAKYAQFSLSDHIFHHRRRDMDALCQKVFGSAPMLISERFLEFRLRHSRLAKLADLLPGALAKPLYRFVALRRASYVALVTKAR